ncbi:hypothetical protein ACN38_g8218, partial [Penicillium nordicum]
GALDQLGHLTREDEVSLRIWLYEWKTTPT